MTAIVRVFMHSSLITAPVSPAGGRFTSDSVSQLKQPYVGRERLTANTISPVVTAAATATAKTRLALVQVQAGKTIHYEITPAGQTLVDADTSSPVLSGETVIEFGPGWQLSVLENSDV